MASTAPEVTSDALSAPLDGGPGTQADAGPPAPAVPPAAEGASKKASSKKRPGKQSAKDLPLSKDEPQEELQPLPEDASGFRKRQKKADYVPVRSSSIPGMTVGDVRKSCT